MTDEQLVALAICVAATRRLTKVTAWEPGYDGFIKCADIVKSMIDEEKRRRRRGMVVEDGR